MTWWVSWSRGRSVSRPIDYAEPIFLQVIGHKQDIAWEEKREADLQKSFMKWISVLQCWPEKWKVRRELDECETVQASCELVSHYFSGKAPATVVKRANSMIYIMEEGVQAWLSVFRSLSASFTIY